MSGRLQHVELLSPDAGVSLGSLAVGYHCLGAFSRDEYVIARARALRLPQVLVYRSMGYVLAFDPGDLLTDSRRDSQGADVVGGMK
jgi:hypothetical protein